MASYQGSRSQSLSSNPLRRGSSILYQAALPKREKTKTKMYDDEK